MINIHSQFEAFPEFMKPADLVQLGLFPSEDALYSARCRGVGPSYIKIQRKILYPKASVIDFVRNHLKDGSIPKSAMG